MKIDLKSLKEKFGKFELSKEEVKKVKGGMWNCMNTGGEWYLYDNKLENLPEDIVYCDVAE